MRERNKLGTLWEGVVIRNRKYEMIISGIGHQLVTWEMAKIELLTLLSVN